MRNIFHLVLWEFIVILVIVAQQVENNGNNFRKPPKNESSPLKILEDNRDMKDLNHFLETSKDKPEYVKFNSRKTADIQSYSIKEHLEDPRLSYTNRPLEKVIPPHNWKTPKNMESYLLTLQIEGLQSMGINRANIKNPYSSSAKFPKSSLNPQDKHQSPRIVLQQLQTSRKLLKTRRNLEDLTDISHASYNDKSINRANIKNPHSSIVNFSKSFEYLEESAQKGNSLNDFNQSPTDLKSQGSSNALSIQQNPRIVQQRLQTSRKLLKTARNVEDLTEISNATHKDKSINRANVKNPHSSYVNFSKSFEYLEESTQKGNNLNDFNQNRTDLKAERSFNPKTKQQNPRVPQKRVQTSRKLLKTSRNLEDLTQISKASHNDKPIPSILDPPNVVKRDLLQLKPNEHNTIPRNSKPKRFKRNLAKNFRNSKAAFSRSTITSNSFHYPIKTRQTFREIKSRSEKPNPLNIGQLKNISKKSKISEGKQMKCVRKIKLLKTTGRNKFSGLKPKHYRSRSQHFPNPNNEAKSSINLKLYTRDRNGRVNENLPINPSSPLSPHVERNPLYSKEHTELQNANGTLRPLIKHSHYLKPNFESNDPPYSYLFQLPRNVSNYPKYPRNPPYSKEESKYVKEYIVFVKDTEMPKQLTNYSLDVKPHFVSNRPPYSNIFKPSRNRRSIPKDHQYSRDLLKFSKENIDFRKVGGKYKELAKDSLNFDPYSISYDPPYSNISRVLRNPRNVAKNLWNTTLESKVSIKPKEGNSKSQYSPQTSQVSYHFNAFKIQELQEKPPKILEIFHEAFDLNQLKQIENRLKIETVVLYGYEESALKSSPLFWRNYPSILLMTPSKPWLLRPNLHANFVSLVFLKKDFREQLKLIKYSLTRRHLKKIVFISEEQISETPNPKHLELFEWLHLSGFWNTLLMDFEGNSLKYDNLSGNFLRSITLTEFLITPMIWSDLKAYPISCSMGFNPPRAFVYRDMENRIIFKGYYGTIINLFASHYNATLKPYILTDLDYYTELDCVKYVNEQKVDICGDVLTYNPEYVITMPEELSASYLMVPYDKPLARFYYFLKPFQLHVWTIVTCSFFYKVITLSFIHRLQHGSWNVSLQMLYAVVSVMFLPFQLTRVKGHYRKFLELIMILVGFVVANWYLSVLSSLLFSRLYSHDIHSLQDLARHNISILVTEFEQYLLNSTVNDPIIMQQLRVVSNEVLSYHRRQLDPQYAYYSQYDKLEFYLHQQKFLLRPRMKILTGIPPVNSVLAGIPMSPNWPFQHLLNRFMRLIVESGLYLRILDNAMEEGILSGYLQYFPNEHHYVEALSIEYFQMPAMLLAVGYSLALLSFIMEIVVFKKFKRDSFI